jgi:hypothetical protein
MIQTDKSIEISNADQYGLRGARMKNNTVALGSNCKIGTSAANAGSMLEC